MTAPYPLPKRVLLTFRSSAASSNLQYTLVSLRLSSSFLRLLPRLYVASIFPSTFPSIMCFRMQFVPRTWPSQLAILLFTVCRLFLSSLSLCNTSSLTRSVQQIFIFLQQHISKLSTHIYFICGLLSEVSKFQHHSKLCCQYSTLLVSSLHVSPFCWWRGSSLCWTLHVQWWSWI